ncbi:Ger(x)C family spore germination protein [Clostridium thailandense]|uniref:Ger(x)C family spore germination protein n=1 Tax=Clostridium thailandense TaxID=2794346 RepID=UPI003988B90D
MRKTGFLLIVLSTIFLFTGCWDYAEYQQIAQIYSVGIDFEKENNDIIVTLQYISTGKTQGGKVSESITGAAYSAKAKTLIDAVNKLQEATPGNLFFSYLQVLVIGEDAATYILKDIISHIERTPSIRNSAYVIITPGKAEGLISTVDPFNPIASGKKIHNLLTGYPNGGSTFQVTIHEFIQMLVKPGIESVASRVVSTGYKNKTLQESAKVLGGTHEDVKFHLQNEGNFRAFGLAAFKGDKFVGWLDDNESLGLSWIKGKKIKTYKSTKTDEEVNFSTYSKNITFNADVKKILYFYITDSKSKIKVQINDKNPEININVKVEAALRKYYTGEGSEYLTPDIVNSMERKLENSIKSDIMTVIQKGQKELKTDIFGFGFNLYRQHPKEWHRNYENTWEEIFPDIPIKVNVDAKINNTGTNIRRLFIK